MTPKTEHSGDDLRLSIGTHSMTRAFRQVERICRLYRLHLQRFLLLIFWFAPTLVCAQSGQALDRLPYEVSIDVRWKGERIQVKRVFSCDLRRRLHPGSTRTLDENLKLRDVWEPNADRISYVLPSREVVIFRTPNICNTSNKWTDPLPENYLPITYWIDNAINPTRAEEVVFANYFTENSRRKLEVTDFRIAEAPGAADRIEGNGGDSNLFASTVGTTDRYFVGLVASAFPQFVWEKFGALAATLSASASGPIDREFVRRSAPFLLAECVGPAQGIGKSKDCMVGPFDVRPYAVETSIERGVWRIDYQAVGVRSFQRHDLIEGQTLKECAIGSAGCDPRQGTYRVEIDGNSFEYPMRDAGIAYDARKKMLVRFSMAVVRSTNAK